VPRRSHRTKGTTGYQAIASELRKAIRDSRIAIGSLLPTERELQDTYSVSRSTVRRALKALIDSGWAESSPNRGVIAKHGPAVGRSTNIGYIDHGHEIQRYLFFKLGQILQSQGYHLVHLDSELMGLEDAAEYADSQGFCGLFVWSKVGYPDGKRLQKVIGHIPVIAVNHSLNTVQTDIVTSDNFNGGLMATRHLGKHGCRNIAVTGMLDVLGVHHERFSGYLMAQFEFGVTPSPSNFAFCYTSGSQEADMRPLIRRLKDKDRPDGIFLLQDMFAPQVVEAVIQCGLRIPDDIRLIAFGMDNPVYIGDCGLTLVAIDWDSIASTLCERMLARLANPFLPSVQISQPVRLIVRGSCGEPASEWEETSMTSNSTGFDQLALSAGLTSR